MKTNIANKGLFLLAVVILFFMVALLLEPAIYMNSALQGIMLWGNNVLPALFPFFFLSTLLIKTGLLEIIGRKLSYPMQRLFHCSGNAGVIYLLSIFSGYPVGAKITSELYLQGSISKEEVMRINAFASTSGPLFIIGSVGIGMFLNQSCGIIILVAHLLGALINGLVYRNYGKNITTQNHIPQKTSSEILSTTMYDSLLSILIVGGYITLFFIGIDVLYDFNILSTFSTLLQSFLNFLGCTQNVSNGILSGILEVTRGCNDLSLSGANLKLCTILSCGLISWGGFSIHLQALTFLSKCKIKFRVYFLQKFTQCIISTILCAILLSFVNI